METGHGAGRSGYRIPVGGETFRSCPDQPWGPPSLLYNGYPVFPGGKERPGRDAEPSPPSSAVGHERVELYLYSPYGPYVLYRASVRVQGWTLPFIFYRYVEQFYDWHMFNTEDVSDTCRLKATAMRSSYRCTENRSSHEIPGQMHTFYTRTQILLLRISPTLSATFRRTP